MAGYRLAPVAARARRRPRVRARGFLPSAYHAPQSVAIGVATETDEALAIGGSDQILAVGVATEVDEAPAIVVTTGAGRAQGGLAFLFTGAADTQVISVGTAVETDSAVAVAALWDQALAVGTATETDLALPLTALWTGPGTADFRLDVSELWDDGAEVGAYRELQFPYEAGAPFGNPDLVAVVADHELFFDGLDPDTTYWAHAGSRRLRFTTDPEE